MDYSRYGLEKKADDLAASSAAVEKRIGVIVIRILFAVFLAGLAAALVAGTIFVRNMIADTPSVDTINISPGGFATFIYDSEGNQLQKLTSSNSNRTAVSIGNVPVDLQHAVIAIEDERFYKHKGIDLKGILRAAAVAVKNRFRLTEGASTITQQLLKNNVFTTWTEEKTIADRIRRKLQEQYLAVKLEEKLQNKDLILENYLNTINLGAGTYGVQAASRKYFNKDVWDLTLSECTVLAGITQNPARYNPIRNPEQNAARRMRVLDKMLEQGYITEEEREEALADPVYERITAAQETLSAADTVYSYFVDELISQVVSDLVSQRGYTENQAYQLLFSGGLRIYTTEDRKIQKICDEEYVNAENFPEETTYSLDFAMTVRKKDGSLINYNSQMLKNLMRQKDSGFELIFQSEEEGRQAVEEFKQSVMDSDDQIVSETAVFSPQPQSSLVIMDQHTGYVKAIVGGRGRKTASLTLNRATGTYRQPGSTFKILSTYAAALDTGLKSLASVVEDAPFTYATGEDVHNSDNNYRGWITIREAIRDSVNVAAVKVLTELSPKTGYEQVRKFGISSLDPARDIVQPLALGGISKGVSNLELTAAYAAIADAGTYIKPVFYTKILDQYGNIVIDNTPETRNAVSESTAWLLTSAMEDVVKSGTATQVQLECGLPTAGKTGTTNDYRNVWFVGFTPYYTMGIWAGYDNNSVLPEEGIYREYHKNLWKKIMDRVCEGLPEADFVKPYGVEQVEICGISGMKPGKYCEFTGYEYVSPEYKPARRCTVCGSGYTGFDYDSYHDETDAAENADAEITDETLIPGDDGIFYEETEPYVYDPEDDAAGDTFEGVEDYTYEEGEEYTYDTGDDEGGFMTYEDEDVFG